MLTKDVFTRSFTMRFNVDKNATGVIVTRVNRGSPAYNGGIRVGDVIQRLNKAIITNIDVQCMMNTCN